jgi:hypothetical protein
MAAGSTDPLKVAGLVGALLDSLGIAYSIGGSLAGSFAGEPRATLDIDMVIDLDSARVTQLARVLKGEFYINEDALRRAVEERSWTNAIHEATSIKVDFFIAGGTPLDADLLRRRIPVSVPARPARRSGCTRLRTSCCRSCAGLNEAIALRIVNGEMCLPSSAHKERVSIARTSRTAPSVYKSSSCSNAR